MIKKPVSESVPPQYYIHMHAYVKCQKRYSINPEKFQRSRTSKVRMESNRTITYKRKIVGLMLESNMAIQSCFQVVNSVNLQSASVFFHELPGDTCRQN